MIGNIMYYILTLIVGALFTYIVKLLNSINGKFKNMELSNQNLLRNNVVRIYYKYKDKKAIPYYDKEVVNMSGDAYRQNGGNSFVDDLIKEINSWEVI